MKGINNLHHVITMCEDPDCEIHQPQVIEDESSRLTACAWYVAGMLATRDALSNAMDEAVDRSFDEILTNLKLKEQL